MAIKNRWPVIVVIGVTLGLRLSMGGYSSPWNGYRTQHSKNWNENTGVQNSTDQNRSSKCIRFKFT